MLPRSILGSCLFQNSLPILGHGPVFSPHDAFASPLALTPGTLCSIHDEFSLSAGGGSPTPRSAPEPLARWLQTATPVKDSIIEDFCARYSRKVVVTSGAITGLGTLFGYCSGDWNTTFPNLSPSSQAALLVTALSGIIFAGLIRRATNDLHVITSPYAGRSDNRDKAVKNAVVLREKLDEAEALARELCETFHSHALSDDLSLAVLWKEKRDRLIEVVGGIGKPPLKSDPRFEGPEQQRVVQTPRGPELMIDPRGPYFIPVNGEEPEYWPINIRELAGGLNDPEYAKASETFQHACRAYPSLVAFCAQPALYDSDPLPLSYPNFLSRPVPGVRQLTHAQGNSAAEGPRFSGTLRVVGWNVNLWGHLAASPKTTEGLVELAAEFSRNGGTLPESLQNKPWPLYGTCFNWRDVERARDIARFFTEEQDGSEPDVICLQEVFDHVLAEEHLWPLLRAKYPYAVIGASGLGIPGILLNLASEHPFLIRLLTQRKTPIQKLIDSLLGGYYAPPPGNTWQRLSRQAKESLMPPKLVMGALAKLFEDPAFWGSGTMILSRYPIRQFGYVRHPVRTDFEVFTDKGVLWADIALSPGRTVRVLNSHMNDGGRPYNEQVRVRQAAHIAQLMETTPHPSLLLADMNADPSSPSYAALANAQRGIRDAFFEATGDRNDAGVYSFHPDNPFARLKGAKDAAHERPGRIDHILLRGNLRPKRGRVTYEDRRKRPLVVNGKDFFRTDHALLTAEIEWDESR